MGNFPWVTNSRQGTIGGKNLPHKNNFQNHTGLDALTGKSNFDISEWMLIQAIEWLQGRDSCIAMLCKTAVARKILNHLYARQLHLTSCSTYNIDAKKHFNANVESCLLICKFESRSTPTTHLISSQYYCDVFENLDSLKYRRIGYRNNILVRDIDTFDRLSSLYDPKSQTKWRSGIKHDCSAVMELTRTESGFINGLGEVVDLEETYLFPLLKGSDVAQNRIHEIERYILVPQKFIGQETVEIETIAPKTWKYLELNDTLLAQRKSKIYKDRPKFSIFGVGEYTFKPWKIAICGLYKKLDFRSIGQSIGRPVVFDDTVYFLSFDDEQNAKDAMIFLTSESVKEFYSSLIFWDDKRPIKSSVLNRLNMRLCTKPDRQMPALSLVNA